jgi:tetratricopeptide (TPR) repeat protein
VADERPDELDNAYFAGRNASEADAAGWKARFEADPQDMLARASWIGWRMYRDLHVFLRSPEFNEQILWLVRNQPGSTLTNLIAPLGAGRQFGMRESELKRAWLAALDQHPEDLRVLRNAASYFGLEDRDKTLELLEAIRIRSKDDPGAEWALASHWLLRARRFRSRFGAAPFEFEKEFDADNGRRALEHAERAIELKGPDSFSEWYEVTRIEAAAAAGAWDRATEVSRAALARIADGSSGRVTGNLAFHANRILGHAALRRADIPAARQHLLACCSGGSSPQLGSFGPDWSLPCELLEHGERGVVLEFLKQCRSIWPGHEDDLDLWERQIQRGETCWFDRAGMSIPRPAQTSAKRPAATLEEEPDDRDPTERAYVAGLRAGAEEAQAWLTQTHRDPEDLCARASWLGWAGKHNREPGVLDEVRAQLEWILQNKPGHPFAGHAAARFTRFGQPSLKQYVDELWTRHTHYPDVRPEVLGNAASHFSSDDAPRALELLARASELDPGNPRWPAQAAWVHFSGARRDGSALRLDEQLDPQSCVLALEEAERAHALANEERPYYLLLLTHMFVAAGAGRWERASEIAREVIQRIPAALILRVRRIHCLTRAHSILGLDALRRGDRDEARHRLRESVACYSGLSDSFVRPNALLALELLALGENDTMLAFLEAVRPLCPDEQAQIDLWQEQVRDGRTPNFGFRWTHL